MNPVIEIPQKLGSGSSAGSGGTTSLDQDRLEELSDNFAMHHENARTMAEHGPTNNVFLKAINAILAVDFYTILNRFDSSALIKRLEQKPELFFQLIDAQCRFAEMSLERDKFEWKKEQADKRRQDREQKLRAKKSILITAETLQSVSAAFVNLSNAGPSICPDSKLSTLNSEFITSPSSIQHPEPGIPRPKPETLELTPEDIQLMEEALQMAAEDSEQMPAEPPFAPSILPHDEFAETTPPDAWLDRQREEDEELLMVSPS